jgi:hypothetical protein
VAAAGPEHSTSTTDQRISHLVFNRSLGVRYIPVAVAADTVRTVGSAEEARNSLVDSAAAVLVVRSTLGWTFCIDVGGDWEMRLYGADKTSK